MLHVVWSQAARRRGRSLAVVAAIVVAAMFFSPLTSAVATSRLQVKGKVAANFRSAYDILVRPHGSQTPLETSDRLVQENYLSGIFGGITMKQYHQIKHLSGVQVAAPIAMVGYTLPNLDVPVVLNKLIDSTTAATGAPRRPPLDQRSRSLGLSVAIDVCLRNFAALASWARLPGADRSVDGLAHPGLHSTSSSTCQFRLRRSIRAPGRGRRASTATPDRHPQAVHVGQVGTSIRYPFPMMIAAIDPKAEAQLVGLKHAVTTGRFLAESDHVTTRAAESSGGVFSPLRYHQVPMLMSNRLVTDQDLKIVVSQVHIGDQNSLPEHLAAPRAQKWLSTRRTRVVDDQSARLRVVSAAAEDCTAVKPSPNTWRSTGAQARSGTPLNEMDICGRMRDATGRCTWGQLDRGLLRTRRVRRRWLQEAHPS